jgi:hypothetical protein
MRLMSTWFGAIATDIVFINGDMSSWVLVSPPRWLES